MSTVSFVTGNEKKFQQVTRHLSGIIDIDQVVYELEEVQIPHIEDISYHKCMQARHHFQSPVLVEDAGIYFDEYQLFPGSFTKWLHKGIGLQGIQKLFANGESKKSSFVSVFSYMDEDLDHPVQFTGMAHGELDFQHIETLGEEPKLPYDTIFKPYGMETVVALDMESWMNGVNHRIKSIEQFKQRRLKQRK